MTTELLDVQIERPGTYFYLDFSSKNGGFAPLDAKMFIIGCKRSTGSAAVEEAVPVLSPESADTLFGIGSELALDCRSAFTTGIRQGSMPRLYGIPLAEPSGGGAAAAVSTITITGTPTVAGELTIRIAGRYIRVGVSTSSTANGIAADVKAAIDAQATVIPIGASVATNVVTCTHRHTGVNGNAVVYESMNVPAGLTVAYLQTVPGVGATDISNALAASLADDYLAGAIANFTAADVTDLEAHKLAAYQSGEKKWVNLVLASTGSLGTVQSLADSNDRGIWCAGARNARSLPGEMAAQVMTLAFSRTEPNFNFDGYELDIVPGNASDAWTAAEVESLLDSGVIPLNRTSDGERVYVEKMVTTQVSQNGVTSFVLRDIAVTKTANFLARQIDARCGLSKPQTVQQYRDLVLDVNREMEAAGYIRKVEEYKARITVEESASQPGRVNITNPIEVVMPIHQAVFLVGVLV